MSGRWGRVGWPHGPQVVTSGHFRAYHYDASNPTYGVLAAGSSVWFFDPSRDELTPADEGAGYSIAAQSWSGDPATDILVGSLYGTDVTLTNIHVRLEWTPSSPGMDLYLRLQEVFPVNQLLWEDGPSSASGTVVDLTVPGREPLVLPNGSYFLEPFWSRADATVYDVVGDGSYIEFDWSCPTS